MTQRRIQEVRASLTGLTNLLHAASESLSRNSHSGFNGVEGPTYRGIADLMISDGRPNDKATPKMAALLEQIYRAGYSAQLRNSMISPARSWVQLGSWGGKKIISVSSDIGAIYRAVGQNVGEYVEMVQYFESTTQQDVVNFDRALQLASQGGRRGFF